MSTQRRTFRLNYRPVLPQRRDVPIGCIGAGFIMAECHLAAYQRAGFRPVAIASRTPRRARQAARRYGIPRVYKTYQELLADPAVEVLDIAVPPDVQPMIVREAVQHARHIRGILCQKPLACNLAEACELVRWCRNAGVVLAVNQNMRYDQSVRACHSLLQQGVLGEPVLATIEMRAIPHWMPWQQRLGWLTLRIMSIHHLDMFRFWFGDPQRVYASVRSDPRTAAQFAHTDGICLYTLEYADGLRAAGWDDVWAGPAREGAAAELGIHWRVEGTDGLACGTIGWPKYPRRAPSTLDFSTRRDRGRWHKPRWREAWFPDAFAGPMAELLCAIEQGRAPTTSGEDNLHTMALVEACYLSAAEGRAVAPAELLQQRWPG
jgi:predicted dehydrogenase